MKTIWLRSALAALALVSFGASQASADVLVNGGFEGGTFSPDSRDTVVLNPGATTISSWTVQGVPGTNVGWIGPANGYGLGNPFLGQNPDGKFLDLTGDSDGSRHGGISQLLNTSTAGVYNLTFYLGSSSLYGPPTGIQVTAGTTVQTFGSTGTPGTIQWELETLQFTSTGATTLLSFLGTAGVNFTGLDEVSVTLDHTINAAVPEPSTWAMMVLGFAGVGFMTYRRRRIAVAI